MSTGSLYKTFLWEGMYYGIIAAVIGSAVGYVCTVFVNAAATDTVQLVAVPILSIIEATALSIGACLIATCIPLKKIAKMNIVESIEAVE
jgi:ABC-type antimicrobial peptide transport system permease subunit